MNNADLAERLATQHEMSKADARRLMDGMLAAIAEAATAGEEVALSGFGRFKVTERAARQGPQPRHRRDHPDRRLPQARLRPRQASTRCSQPGCWQDSPQGGRQVRPQQG